MIRQLKEIDIVQENRMRSLIDHRDETKQNYRLAYLATIHRDYEYMEKPTAGSYVDTFSWELLVEKAQDYLESKTKQDWEEFVKVYNNAVRTEL